jgi:hypothetical protein
MGMFDRVSFEDIKTHFDLIEWGDLHLESDIVDKIKEDNDFQTKCLDNYFDNYMISYEGYLKSQHFEEYEYVNQEDCILRFKINKKGEYWMDENYHGIITIRNNNPIENDNYKIYTNFKLKFTDGRLVSIKCSEIDKI